MNPIAWVVRRNGLRTTSRMNVGRRGSWVSSASNPSESSAASTARASPAWLRPSAPSQRSAIAPTRLYGRIVTESIASPAWSRNAARASTAQLCSESNEDGSHGFT